MASDTKAFPIQKSDEEWRRTLTPEQYYVLREHGTERAGTCALLREKRTGTFTCAGCGQPLFVADTKLESGLRYCINGVALNFSPTEE
jgi:peptide-methionine (R)-S-oxide reductase